MKLRVEKAIYGGAGLARLASDSFEQGTQLASLAGKAIFTPYVLPGELVEGHIHEDRRSYATADVDFIVEPSPERVTPSCEYFPACGGCQYQHANAGYQLQMKLDILRETFERAHLNSYLDAFGSIESLSATPWGYRNRIRLHIVRRNGKLALCYRERNSNKDLPVAHCPIAAPILDRAIAAVMDLEEQSEPVIACDEIELFTNGNQDSLLVSLWTSRPFSRSNQRVLEALKRFAEPLKLALPELVGVGLFSASNGMEKLLCHWGQPSLTYNVLGHEYLVSLGSFFQINRFLLPQLVKLVSGGRSGKVAWDLYAGVGLFSCALRYDRVTAVESSSFSVSDLKHNLAGTSHSFVRKDTLDFLRCELRRGPSAKPDLVLLDPPRAGLGKDICSCLAQIAAPEIIYVSCDPATLARDLQALLQSGYRLQKLNLVDLFPQTYHLETLAVLARD